MTFQELLTKTRGEDWKPPKLLFAIDPGETCGYASFIDGRLHYAAQEKGTGVVDLMTMYEYDIIVYEDYKIYPRKLKLHSFADIPTLKIIGIIEYVCASDEILSYSVKKVIKQLASTAKGFCTNIKLKEWGFYQKGRPHANDAIRHGCHALLFSKELW